MRVSFPGTIAHVAGSVTTDGRACTEDWTDDTVGDFRDACEGFAVISGFPASDSMATAGV